MRARITGAFSPTPAVKYPAHPAPRAPRPSRADFLGDIMKRSSRPPGAHAAPGFPAVGACPLLMPDRPSIPDSLYSSFSSAAGGHAALTDPDRAARRDRSHPGGCPWEIPSSGEKPMVESTLCPARSAHRLAPLPRCATITPAVCNFRWRAWRQGTSNVFVGQSVKAVAPHPGLVEFPGQRRTDQPAAGGVRVKRRVETGDLRQFRPRFSRSARIAARLCGSCRGRAGSAFPVAVNTASSTRTGWE